MHEITRRTTFSWNCFEEHGLSCTRKPNFSSPGDIEENICFYSFRNSHWYASINCLFSIDARRIKICLCKCFILIKVLGYRPLNKIYSLVFFKHFGHTTSFMLCRIAILKNICFSRTPLMAAPGHSLNSND